MTSEAQIENNLFNDKKMEEFIELYDDSLIVNADCDPISYWIKKLEQDELRSEKANYIRFFKIILENILGYEFTDIEYEENIGDEGRPVEFTLKKDNHDYVVVELKGTTCQDLNKRYNRQQSPIEQVTNYASIKEETRWAFVSNYNEFRLFNPSYREKYISFKFKQLTDPEILKKFLLIFSKFSLIEKDIPQTLLKETKLIERELEDEFYKLFSETRLMLIEELKNSSESIDNLEAIRLSQLILNRYIFLCFAEDLKLIPPETTSDILLTPIEKKNLSDKHSTMWKRLNELFIFADEGNKEREIGSFNGGLFAEDLYGLKIRDKVEDLTFFKDCYRKWKFEEKYETINDKLGVYKDNLNPIYKNLLTISSFKFDSELDVNILGHIFENSIGDIEELKDETTKRRKKEGVFYTPEFITDYLCRNTIIPYLSINGKATTVHELIKEYEEIGALDELDDKLKSMKIIDPACGSGACLNKAVDVLFEIHKALYDSKYSDEKLDKYVFDSLDSRRQIIINNIYGVDLNEESVEITKLSLFLKLSTSTGVKEGFKLPNLDKNIKCGNSLCDDETIEKNKAFNWNEEFREVFDNGGFDVVIGNPPYVSVGKSKYPKIYKDYLKNNFESAYQKYDLYVLFIELSLKILKNNGQICYIVPFPLLNQDYGLKLRQMILNDCEIKEIFDLSNYKIFSDAEVRNIIITLKKTPKINNNDNNLKVKKQITEPQILTKQFKYLKQDIFNSTYQNMFRLELNDIKVYNLIKKLQNKSNKKLGDVVFSSWGARGTPIKEFHLNSKINENCKKMIKGANINRFSINYDGKWLNYDLDKLYRPSMIEFFEPEKIIVKKVSGKEGLIATYDDKGYYTDDSLCCISLKHNFKELDPKILKKHKLILNEEDIENSQKYNLKYLLAFINSNVTNFYFKNMIGYDLNVYPTNILELPFISLEKENQIPFIELVEEILSTNMKLTTEIESFKKWLKRTFEIDQLSPNLESYYEYDFDNLLSELKTKKMDIKPRATQELLENEYTSSLSTISSLQEHLKKSYNELNDNIYNLYNLTPEEIEIIENSFITNL